MMQPTAITVAPNGGRRTRKDHPGLPMTARELAVTAAGCVEAGASMIHVHVRDASGRHVLDVDLYRQAIDAIRDTVGDRLVIQVTTEALGSYSPAQQIDLVRQLRPEAASLALGELAPDAAHEAAFAELLSWMRDNDVMPQIILYSAEEMVRLRGLMKRGVLPVDDIPMLFVLGRYSRDQTSRPEDLLPFLAGGTPEFSHWSVCAFGPNETACVTAGALMGGHARVGFENNFHLPDGRMADSNAELVASVARALGELGGRPTSADELRSALARCFAG